MFRTRSRGPRRPKVYRIPIETYLIALAIAFALSVAFSLLSVPKEIDYRLAHHFGVEEETFLPSAHALSNASPVEGNRIRLLENGDAFFPAMLAAIARAQSSINLETYIFWSGEIAGRFRDALSERARAGVEVRILLDAVGSGAKLSRDDVSAMRSAGCAVEFFHPLRPWMLDTINHRTHRRILVVDGRVGFTGGAGVADVCSPTKLLYAVSISSAMRRLWISNSYFLPDADVTALLVSAARRGVDVHILIPGKVNDVPLTRAGGRSSLGDLLAGGVKISEYGPTMFHAKTMVVDGVFPFEASCSRVSEQA
jgi:phosphatidylserine/phosphatidylglycerophosphate/cardiolipin synthase-like enzyme